MRLTDQPAARAGAIPQIDTQYLGDETTLARELTQAADCGEAARASIQGVATQLVEAVRLAKQNDGGIERFLQQYDLSSEEGVLLMCIAEALLRIPDARTADELIADKLTAAHWNEHLGESDSLFVNASTWSLMLTGRLLDLDRATRDSPLHQLGKLLNRAGEPVVRAATRQAMRIMGHQFVMGRTIAEALKRARADVSNGYRFSFDMLGEAALTAADSQRYLDSYHHGIGQISAATDMSAADIFAAPGVSVKLSALHPRLVFSQRDRVLRELAPRLTELVLQARECGVGLTIDSEEADRLALTLELFEAVYRDSALGNYEGFGIAVPTYQRRARDVFVYLIELSRSVGRRIPVRLVKGAYWDAEIKRAQEQGLESFPVFTRKAHTDVSYLACARLALESGKALYPQFATHNAHTLASLLHFAGERRDFEFQRLHGMGMELYAEIIDPQKFDRPCRVYAPVGSHEDLLPYLVRRLLENGSNSSFVNRIVDRTVAISEIVADPLVTARALDFKPHPRIVPASKMFGTERRNSRGVNLPDAAVLDPLLAAMQASLQVPVTGHAIVDGREVGAAGRECVNPANNDEVIGSCKLATPEDVDAALEAALAGQPAWDRTPAAERAAILNRVADLYEENQAELLALCVGEGGKTIPNAISELREAVDFLRYYAAQCERLFAEPVVLPGPTGETNTLSLRGRGVFVCISPWNFPLAIFTGQVTAALAAGNAVLAKPAGATPLVAFRAVQLMLAGGIPAQVLHFLPGSGALIGQRAASDPRVAGVAFTGSTETAWQLNRTLAERRGPIGVLIAETGGQNAMFVDSSALPQQVVVDAVASAFDSAGQRCSALRLICLQRDIAPKIKDLLAGYMEQLSVGDPALLSTDIGPVIDAEAMNGIESYIDRMASEASVLQRCALHESARSGHFVAPALVEIDDIGILQQEVFGPVLHVVEFRDQDLEATVAAVNATGYGLTMGLHSRIEARARKLIAASGAGNIYINRNMIGAIVGVQPFGGRGLSGTGPKAGGPHYLLRFASEVAVSTNLAAVGGNATLLSLGGD